MQGDLQCMAFLGKQDRSLSGGNYLDSDLFFENMIFLLYHVDTTNKLSKLQYPHHDKSGHDQSSETTPSSRVMVYANDLLHITCSTELINELATCENCKILILQSACSGTCKVLSHSEKKSDTNALFFQNPNVLTPVQSPTFLIPKGQNPHLIRQSKEVTRLSSFRCIHYFVLGVHITPHGMCLQIRNWAACMPLKCKFFSFSPKELNRYWLVLDDGAAL